MGNLMQVCEVYLCSVLLQIGGKTKPKLGAAPFIFLNLT